MKEVTQFSRIEFDAVADALPMADPQTAKDKAMNLFHAQLQGEHSPAQRAGGRSNIKTIRVYETEKGIELRFTTILSEKDLAKRAKDAAEQARRDGLKAKNEAQRKAKQAKKSGKPQKQRKDPKAFLKSPEGAKAAYEAALKADRRNRKPAKQVEVIKKPTLAKPAQAAK